MTPQQITLVQSSYARLGSEKTRIGDLLFDRLFAAEPQARLLFKSGIVDHAPVFNRALELVVNGLSDPDTLVAWIKALGCRHATYGVETRHYAVVGGALLGALDEVMGADFDPKVRDAWTAAYGLLSTIMQAAAAEWLEAARTASALDRVPADLAAA